MSEPEALALLDAYSIVYDDQLAGGAPDLASAVVIAAAAYTRTGGTFYVRDPEGKTVAWVGPEGAS
jgi:hypothetical protein